MQLAQREAWGTIFQFVLDQSFVFVWNFPLVEEVERCWEI